MIEIKENIAIGADIGGSHITTALIDITSNQIIKNTFYRERVDPHTSASEIIDNWAACIKKTLKGYENQTCRLGIAMPGPFDYENGISKMKDNAKFEALYNLNVKTILAQKIFIQPSNIEMMNDAGCFLQGEVFCGAAKGYKDVIGLTLGTGLGTAKYHNGKGEDANLWSMPFKNNIAENYISSRWFVNRYYELTGRRIKDVKELSELYHVDHVAVKIFYEFGSNLSQFLLRFIALEQPEIIVLGGNITNAYPLFKNVLLNNLIPNHPNIKIAISQLGESAALIGAASFWNIK